MTHLFRIGSLSVILALALVPTSGCFTSAASPTETAYSSRVGWIIDAAAAEKLHTAGATFVDVRDWKAYTAQHIVGSRHGDWLEYSQPSHPHRGKLLADDAALTKRLRELGVFKDRAVVVVGDPIGGWGEDGRFAWMFRTLGHARAFFVDGGFRALAERGIPLTGDATATGKGDFALRRRSDWLIDAAGLRTIVEGKGAGGSVVIVDTRERREFDGQTPYGEDRGGHVPGAVHLHYKDLLSSYGGLRSREALLARVKALGITDGTTVLGYCTGGVRSAWFSVILIDLGFKNVRNYAGSMWDWSARPAAEYPLTK